MFAIRYYRTAGSNSDVVRRYILEKTLYAKPKLQYLQGRAKKFEKKGPQFPVFVYSENIGEDQKKKGLHVFPRPIYPPKSSEDQKLKKKGQRVLRCSVSLTADIYHISL